MSYLQRFRVASGARIKLKDTSVLGNCISGEVLYDETIRQQKKDGTRFVGAMTDARIISGITVATGAKDMSMTSIPQLIKPAP